MPISPISFTITAVSPMPGWPSRRADQRRLAAAEKPGDERDGELAVSRQERARDRGRAGRAAGRRGAPPPPTAHRGCRRRPTGPCGRAGRRPARPSRRAAGRSGRAPCSRASRERPAPAPPAVLLGPVLFEEHSAESAHVVALYHPDGGGEMAKEILCCIGIDVDAVAGWLGSYGGEDSPDDISRGLFAGEVGTPPSPEAVRQVRPEDDLVHPRPLDRDVPGGDEADRRRGARDRHARLLAREPDLDDARAGGGRADQVHRPDRERLAAGGRPATSRRGGSSRTSRTSCSSSTGSSTTTA